MSKKFVGFVLILLFSAMPLFAEESQDQEYVNKLNYRRNKMQIVTKQRLIDIKRSYSSTDISTTTYSYEAFTQTYGNISTQALSQAEAKEIREWYILKGGLRELSDLEFLELVGDAGQLARVRDLENRRANMRLIGNVSIGLGLLAMIGGAALSAGQAVITGGALVTTAGFFISAFNLSPQHYIAPDYAQEKIDEYNINLKKKLNLPLQYE